MTALVALAVFLLVAPFGLAAEPPSHRVLEHDGIENDDPGIEDDERSEPKLPDDEPLGQDDDMEERSPSRPPGPGQRSAPTLPGEDEDLPPVDVEPAHTGPAYPAGPAQPVQPGPQ